MLRSLLMSILLSCCAPPSTAEPAPPPEPSAELSLPVQAAWPAEAAVLSPLEAPPSEGARGLKLSIDPGHGVGSNSGNNSCLCIDEQDHNLRVGRHLQASLDADGRHQATLTRQDNAGPGYGSRIERARVGGADLLLSLHSDARGQGASWAPREDRVCSWNDANPGFSVLWSDEGAAELSEARLALARALARRLTEAGFLPYDGHEYYGLYEGDPDHPGVFVDRHQPNKRIRMLRRPTMPSVIIETHNAWDRHEEPRWQEDATLVAFDSAVLAALADWSAEP